MGLFAFTTDKLADGWILILDFKHLRACPHEQSTQDHNDSEEKKQQKLQNLGIRSVGMANKDTGKGKNRFRFKYAPSNTTTGKLFFKTNNSVLG